MNPIKIVVSGGPCAGKSTAMAHISDRVGALGYKVYIVPEVATALLLGGMTPWNYNKDQTLAFEENLIKLQMAQEDAFYNVAVAAGGNSVIVCDRGVMDASAYIPKDMWDIILKNNKLDNVAIRDKRYDAVIHMVTAAKGAAKFYTTANNAARTETAEQAAVMDDKIQAAWVGHPHLRVIGNEDNFNTKINNVVSSICRVIGIPDPLEIERKYLVEDMPIIPIRHEEIDIEQVYLVSTDGTSSRIRKRGQRGSYIYTHTSKKNIGVGQNIEVERMVTSREYNSLLSQADRTKNKICKKRYCFIWNERYFELDYFIKPSSIYGLVMLEVELDNIDEEIDFPPFIKIIKDVTGLKSYSNSELSRSGR